MKSFPLVQAIVLAQRDTQLLLKQNAHLLESSCPSSRPLVRLAMERLLHLLKRAGAAALGPDGNAHSLCGAQEEIQTHEICKKIQHRRFLRKDLCSCTMDSPGGWGGVSKNNEPRDQKGVVKWEQVRVQIHGLPTTVLYSPLCVFSCHGLLQNKLTWAARVF